MRHYFFIFLFLLTFLFGCNKPNKNPEQLDPVYLDMERRLSNIQKEYEEEKKTVEENESALNSVIPQTGQNKYARKRLLESRARMQKLYQTMKYQELRVASRITYVKQEYLKRYKANQTWPDPSEYSEYQATLSAQEAPRMWSPRERINESNKKKKSP